METEIDAIHFETLTIQTPEGCPQPTIFEKIIKELLAGYFQQPDSIRQCRDSWLAIRAIPEPFSSSCEASYHYHCAMLALHPQAQKWDDFQNAASEAFLDYDEYGADQEQPIPGWTLPCGVNVEIIG